MSLEERLKFGPYLTIYNKDYVKKKITSKIQDPIKQEFQDPICEGFKHYLEVDKSDNIQPPSEAGEDYLEKVIKEKPKIAKIFFQTPIDRLTVRGNQLLKGKSVYQVEYCDIEAEIRRKLVDANKNKPELPEGWKIPLTTQKYDFRPPLVLSKHAMDRVLPLKPPVNLGQNEKVNKILHVKTGDSEYNQVIGKLGEFIVKEQMHGKIEHPGCDNTNKSHIK